MNEKKIGLAGVVATGVGLVVASSCLFTLGAGISAIGTSFIISMIIACIVNILTLLSISELNSLMPNLTGGLAQYSLACVGPFLTIICMVGGYILCNSLAGSVEGAMFGNTVEAILPNTGIPSWVYATILIGILFCVNLNGVDMFIKIQDFVAYALIGSLFILGIIGAAKAGTGEIVNQPRVIASDFKSVTGLCGAAFFLFVGGEYVVPISKDVKNAKRNIPLGMVLSMVIILIMQIILTYGFAYYTPWEELSASGTPHVLYGQMVLGNIGKYWMMAVAIFATVSSINTLMSSLAYIIAGMSKIGLLPAFFQKTNKKGVPVIGLVFEALFFIIINVTGLSSSDQVAFFISVLAILWLISYIISNVDVLILRRKMPNAPRNFKLPLGPIIPILGVVGSAYMIYNMDPSWDVKLQLYTIDGITIVVLAIYAFFWVKCKMKKPMFKAYPIKEVMAMENELYAEHHRKVAK
ncbi:MAG: APC family permease [Coprococcus sp.]|nr:APC family permease [Coprococcus sp.]